MALTPNDVLNKQFQTTKFRDGYDQDEVDDFLDEVLAEFQRLIAENDQLKSQVGSAPVASAAPVDSGEADALREQLAAAQGQVAALSGQLAESQQALQTAQQQAAAGSTLVDGMNSAEYLQLARRVHEEHVREGVVKRDELIAEGEAKAATLLVDAEAKAAQLGAESQAQAGTVLGDARTQADTLVGEAQAQRDTLVGTLNDEVATLTTQRDGLQGQVDELKEFERTYRASLKTYLETQLGELAGSGVDAPPAEAAAPAWDSPLDAAPAAAPAWGAGEAEAPEVPASFEVPPVVEESAPVTGGVQWSGFSVEPEVTASGPSSFGAPSFGDAEPTPVTYEIPGFESPAPEASEDTDGERSAPGFGGN